MIKKTKIGNAQLQSMAARYADGASIRTIAEEFGGSYGWTREQLVGAGVQMRPCGGSRGRRKASPDEPAAVK